MKKYIFLTICFVLMQIHSAAAQNTKPIQSLKEFKKIAILHEGRIKPLDTYAQNFLLQLSGKTTFQKKEAIEWLAGFLFNPDSIKNDRVFLINNPDIPEALGIPVQKRRRYTFAEIQPYYLKLKQLADASKQIDSKERDLVESELIRVFTNIELFADLSLSFAFTHPSENFTITDETTKRISGLPIKQNQFSFIDIALRAHSFEQLAQPLERIPQENWTEAQKEIVATLSNLLQSTIIYQQLPLKIIPSYSANQTEWLSPWDALSLGLADEEGRKELEALNTMANAYKSGNQLEFDLSVRLFNDSIIKRLERRGIQIKDTIKTEVFYNKLNLFYNAKVLYLTAFFLFLLHFIIRHRIIYTLGWQSVALGCLLHAVALILRMIILKRPPVSNLYETFIFVSFISVCTGLLIERVQRQWLGTLIASICGSVFLLIGAKFAAEGDTLQMLVAVLNSNFWLGTHVLTITIGYAGTCVAGVIGHVYILQMIFNPEDKKKLHQTNRILIGALGFGLTMTFLGTNLGGIWADQSWGRFWGWDPKENGALLIILWLAMLFHARLGKLIGPLGLAVGSALSIIVVMWAWFGVNLLSVGLHSYGFTAGLATNLLIYFICQVLFIGVATPLALKKKTLNSFKEGL